MIRVHPDARIELRAAWLTFGEVSERLATRFQSDIEAAFAAIEEGPLRWPRGTLGTRRYVVRRFHFVLVYRIHGEDILVFAASHGRRRPKYWANRLDHRF